MSLRRTSSQTPMPRHHWTSFGLACFILSVSSTPPHTSSTKVSSAKQAVTDQLRMLPHWKVLRRLEGLRERLSGRIPPTPQSTERMPIHLSLARACQARFQKRFHATARTPLSSNTIQGSFTNPDSPDSKYQRHMGPSVLETLGCEMSLRTHNSFQDDAFNHVRR